MKKIKILTVLFFAFTLSVNITKAEDSKIPDNSNSILKEATHLFTAMISNARYLEMETAPVVSETFKESEILIEESLELEEWMLDYKWLEKEEVIAEEEFQLELWMKSPKNWNIYSCE